MIAQQNKNLLFDLFIMEGHLKTKEANFYISVDGSDPFVIGNKFDPIKIINEVKYNAYKKNNENYDICIYKLVIDSSQISEFKHVKSKKKYRGKSGYVTNIREIGIAIYLDNGKNKFKSTIKINYPIISKAQKIFHLEDIIFVSCLRKNFFGFTNVLEPPSKFYLDPDEKLEKFHNFLVEQKILSGQSKDYDALISNAIKPL